MDSTRGIIFEWAVTEINGSDEISIATLTDDAFGHFKADRPFIDQFIEEHLRDMIYQLVRKAVMETRQTYQVGGVIVGKGVEDKSVQVKPSKWSKWLEFDGENHVRLPAMTKPQLLSAASLRRDTAQVQLDRAELLERLAKRLKNNTERVSDRFNMTSDLDKIWADIIQNREKETP